MATADRDDETVQVCATLTAVENIEKNFMITLATSDNTGEKYMCSVIIIILP